ncbi:MAG TPA: right-handed parallel beta-helix repeat-containing protein, partial [Geobacteraceae bacterium]
MLWSATMVANAATAADQVPKSRQPGTVKPGTAPVLAPRTLVPVGATDLSYRSTVLAEDTVWHGAILVEGWLIVPPKVTLTLQPGTTVRFKGGGGGSSGLLIQGRLQAFGTQQQPIVLTSPYAEPNAGDWQGIRFIASEKNNLMEHCRIEGADRGLEVAYSTLTATNLRVTGCQTGIFLQDAVVTLNEIMASGCETGLDSDESELDLREPVLADNRTGITASGTSLIVRGGRITGNRHQGLAADNCRLRLAQTIIANNGSGAVLTGCEGSLSACRLLDQLATAL